MANTFTALHCHFVFPQKNRERWLAPVIEKDVWRYLGDICRAHGIKALQIGGDEDHVHFLLGIPPALALSDVMKRIKGESSKWLSREKRGMADFAWQDGWGGFSIGKSQITDTAHYIRTSASIIW